MNSRPEASEGVAQNCILLYRRFVICWPSDLPTTFNNTAHLDDMHSWQNTILRYSHGCPDVLGCECIFN